MLSVLIVAEELLCCRAKTTNQATNGDNIVSVADADTRDVLTEVFAWAAGAGSTPNPVTAVRL